MSKHTLLSPIFLVFILITAIFFIVDDTAAQEMPGDRVTTDCPFEGYQVGPTTLTGEALGFSCGYVVVPERHANPDGPTIRIPFAVRQATGNDVRPDPLVIAQGGPGGDAFKIFTLLVPNTEIGMSRDIIVFNQRGTPYADPELSCPETTEILPEMLTATDEEGKAIYNEAIDACYARLLAEGIDLSAYNSLENAADIPILVDALGYDEYNFYGVSYGTLLGLHLMRNHPDDLRSVILDSVVPPHINTIEEVSRSEDRVLQEIFANCEADTVCREQYPGLAERYFALIRQYDENPVMLTLTDPETGEKYDALLDGSSLRSTIFTLLYSPGMNAVLPKVIVDLEEGDTRYLQMMLPLIVFDQLIAQGMYNSVMCAEDSDIDVDAISLDSLRPDIAATAREELQAFVDGCARWQVEQLSPSVDDPVMSNIPTLIFSGYFDPVTPPAFAEAAAEGLTNVTHLVDPVSAHGGVFQSVCSPTIVAAFLDAPMMSPDATCLREQDILTAVPPDAIIVPLIMGVNRLDIDTLIFFVLSGFLLLIVLSPFLVWPVAYLIRAFSDNQPVRTPEDRRVRLISRVPLLLFGLMALIFAVGLLSFIIYFIATNDQVMLTALALPPSAAPLMWIPIILIVLAIVVAIGALMLLRSSGSSSTAGKIYYSVVALAAVSFVVLLGTQGLLRPPL